MTAAQDRLRDALVARHLPGTVVVRGVESGRAHEEYPAAQAVAALERIGYTVHPPGQTCPIAHPRARSTDPGTSAAAATRALPTARAHAARLLERYAVEDRTRQDGFRVGYNADEVALAAGLSGAWRRVSELAALDLIEPVPGPGDPPPPTALPLTRPGRSGAQQTVYRITDKGRRHVASLFPGEV